MSGGGFRARPSDLANASTFGTPFIGQRRRAFGPKTDSILLCRFPRPRTLVTKQSLAQDRVEHPDSPVAFWRQAANCCHVSGHARWPCRRMLFSGNMHPERTEKSLWQASSAMNSFPYLLASEKLAAAHLRMRFLAAVLGETGRYCSYASESPKVCSEFRDSGNGKTVEAVARCSWRGSNGETPDWGSASVKAKRLPARYGSADCSPAQSHRWGASIYETLPGFQGLCLSSG